MNDPQFLALVSLLRAAGVTVECGPVQLSYREEGDKVVCRVDVETRVTFPPHWLAKIPIEPKIDAT